MKFNIDDGILLSVEGLEKNVKIPGCVTEISKKVFKNHKEIQNIEIPNSLKKIGAQAFYDCEQLTTIKLPKELEEIGKEAFSHCESLSSINIPNKIEKISDCTFKGCTKLTKINFLSNLKEIGFSAFSGCMNLKEINFPPSLKLIGINAFTDCNKINITLPNNLNEIKFALDLEEIGIDNLVLSSKDKNHIIKFQDNKKEIVFNYTLFPFKENINYLIKTLNNKNEYKIFYFLIKLCILYSPLDELSKMVSLLDSIISVSYAKESKEIKKLVCECRYLEDNKENNYLKFKQIADTYRYDYDYSELDKLLLKNTNILNCTSCGKQSLVINKDKNIYICFNCNKYGKVTDLDIVKKTKTNKKLKYYDEIYNELKENNCLKTKEYALYGITFYKLNSYFIAPDLYEDEDILYELIKNNSFDNRKNIFNKLQILENDNFKKRILELDEYNKRFIDMNKNKDYNPFDEFADEIEIFDDFSFDDLESNISDDELIF